MSDYIKGEFIKFPTGKTINIANTAGFCFGVSRAVDLVYSLLDKGEKVCTLGPIIHNPQLVADLTNKGVVIAGSVDEIPSGYTAIIRSHGVPGEIFNNLENDNIAYEDATCPFVKKIHNIALKQSQQGEIIFIAGDEQHPEVHGIRGYIKGKSYVFKNNDELEELLKSQEDFVDFPVSVVAQTTFSVNEWKKCIKSIKKVCTNAKIFDTICNATSERQHEAVLLSQKSDLMIVIGGRQSSNTRKLFDACCENCNTIHVETADEIPINAVTAAERIGITAGASTPAAIIKEVFVVMSDIINNNETNETVETKAKSFDEMTFEEALEESLKSLTPSERVKGTVIRITPSEVQVDVGRKQAGFIPIDELSNDPSAKAEDIVKEGDVLDLLIMRTNDQEGTIMLSKKRVDAAKQWDDIVAASENNEILEGKVIEVIKGGVIVLYGNVRIFVPASQATLNRNDPLEDLIGKKVRFRIIEASNNRGRKRAVGSIRVVAREERKAASEKFWKEAAVGNKYTGVVKSLTQYGAFVDIGGVDGMIHISELSWGRIKHPSEVVNVGDVVDVYIKDLDAEKKRISLGFRKIEDNPWEILKNKYPIGTVTKAKIVGITQFGAFANIIPGIDGLIHISQIADRHIDKPSDVLSIGQEVTVKITDIDFERKRVSLSIRALLEPQNEADQQAETPAEAAETVAEEPAQEETPAE